MNEKQKKVSTLVIMQLAGRENVESAEIMKFINLFASLNPMTDIEKKAVLKDVESKIQINVEKGIIITEHSHLPWYNSAKSNIDPKFWNRYKLYLRSQGWNNAVLNEMDDATDAVMDLLGNPCQKEGFNRRGLCIGEVQSGKTSNYIALINKAADAGYKVIILLTGVMEKLRAQTQERVDLGFTGTDSDAFLKHRKGFEGKVGVGKYDNKAIAWSVTSKSSDFKQKTASSLIPHLDKISVPIIFVMKKNRSVLQNLSQWLELADAGVIDVPMLLIDDEADNASINTHNADTDPTAINKAIRELLNKFLKSDYLGFTATPYANIFIDPETEDDMFNEDLFPRDFIYCLPSPSNYIGPDAVFTSDGKYRTMLHNNDDCEDYVPMKHKKEFFPSPQIPKSLETAICSFMLINVIRDLRGNQKAHRTMMINLSRFIAVQNRVRGQVSSLVKDYQNAIQNYYMCGSRALRYPEFQKLKWVFDQFFRHCLHADGSTLITWDEVQKNLKNAVMPINVDSVNGGNAVRILNYENYADTGLRLIAVGGLSLSRGLTLEGLCVSYFHRNSKMYDTLMQMGRWFGYRSGYDDLCQIWMPDTAIDWYRQITEATDELKEKIQMMRDQNKTPQEFGLCVRQDKGALLVTARNKMKSARTYVQAINLSGSVIETAYLPSRKGENQANLKATDKFLKNLKSNYDQADNNDLFLKENIQFLNVDWQFIQQYLREYHCHNANRIFKNEDIEKALFSEQKKYTNWDVAVASGRGDLGIMAGLRIKPVIRTFRYNRAIRALQISGSNVRLGTQNMSAAGLTKKQVEEVKEKFSKEKSLSGTSYFRAGIDRNPLLIIYPVILKAGKEKMDKETQEILDYYKDSNALLIGLAIGIPLMKNVESIVRTYKMNAVMQKEIFGMDENDNDFDEDEYESEN